MISLLASLTPSLAKLIPYALAVAATSAVIFMIYNEGASAAKAQAEAIALRTRLALLTSQVVLNAAIKSQDDKQHDADAAEIAGLNSRIEELNANLSAPGTVCLGPDDTRRLQDIFKH